MLVLSEPLSALSLTNTLLFLYFGLYFKTFLSRNISISFTTVVLLLFNMCMLTRSRYIFTHKNNLGQPKF